MYFLDKNGICQIDKKDRYKNEGDIKPKPQTYIILKLEVQNLFRLKSNLIPEGILKHHVKLVTVKPKLASLFAQ